MWIDQSLSLIICLKLLSLCLACLFGLLPSFTEFSSKTSETYLNGQSLTPSDWPQWRHFVVLPDGTKRYFAFFFALFFFPSVSQASYCGHLALGIMSKKYPCDDFLNEVNAAKHPATGVLWDSSFGNNRECLKRFLASNQLRPHAVIVYLDNGAGRRNRTLERGDFFPRLSSGEYNQLLRDHNAILLNGIAQRIAEIRAFFETFGSYQTQTILVPGLEDNYSREAWIALGAVIAEHWPYVFARNPEGSNRDQGLAWFKETHGGSAKCHSATQIASLDGTVLSQSSMKKWLRRNNKCFVALTYTPASQGRKKNGAFVDHRAEREFQIESWIGNLLAGECQ